MQKLSLSSNISASYEASYFFNGTGNNLISLKINKVNSGLRDSFLGSISFPFKNSFLKSLMNQIIDS